MRLGIKNTFKIWGSGLRGLQQNRTSTLVLGSWTPRRMQEAIEKSRDRWILGGCGRWSHSREATLVTKGTAVTQALKNYDPMIVVAPLFKSGGH